MHNFGGGRSDLFNSGEVVKRGKGYFQNSEGSWLKGGVKKFRGVWTLDEAMGLRYYVPIDGHFCQKL